MVIQPARPLTTNRSVNRHRDSTGTDRRRATRASCYTTSGGWGRVERDVHRIKADVFGVKVSEV